MRCLGATEACYAREMPSRGAESLGARLAFAVLILVVFGVAAVVIGFLVAGCNRGLFGVCVLARPTLGAAVASVIGGAGLALSFRAIWPGTRQLLLWLPAAAIATGFWVFVAFID